MKKLPTIEEFDRALNNLLEIQCIEAKSVVEASAEPEIIQVTADEALTEYLRVLNNYMNWRMIPAHSAYNIDTNYGQISEYGQRIGFIDGGLMMKTGKKGILFFEKGLAVKVSSKGKPVNISYSDLCRSSVKKIEELVSGENRLSVVHDHIVLINATKRIFERLRDIRATFINSSIKAEEVFRRQYVCLVDGIKKSASDGRLDEAEKYYRLLCDYVSCDKKVSLPIPVSAEIALLMLGHKFDNAAALASMYGLVDWQRLAKAKKDEYFRILSKGHYVSAIEYYNKCECEKCLDSVKQSIKVYPTLENYTLYYKAVNRFAEKSNMFLYKETERIINSVESAVEIQKEALEKNAEIIEILKLKQRRFTVYLRELMIDRILNEDIEFFRKDTYEIRTYRDKYGMNALSYAALYRKYSMLNEMMRIMPNNITKNIIGQNPIEISVFSGLNIFEYDNFAGNYNHEYTELKKTVLYQPQDQENHGYNPSRLSIADNPKTMHYYTEQKNYMWNPVLNYVNSGMSKIPEFIADGEFIKDYKLNPAYKEAFEHKKEKFIQEYVRKYQTPKDEFETTPQYIERQNNLNLEAAEAFVKDSVRIMHEYEEKLRISAVHQKLCVELSYIYLFSYFSGNAHIGRYDADKQIFSMKWSNIETSVSVPLSEARHFKEMYIADGVPFDVERVSVDDKLTVTAQCVIKYKGNEYQMKLIKKYSNEKSPE